MKYYLIVGEASGDLHASHLMASLRARDSEAEFRFFGGDLMAAVGGTCVKHYRELAYMGFVPVLLHIRTIFKNMAMCKKDIIKWSPDVVILVDYAGFNLNIAKFVHTRTRIPVYYYILPKIWAWKEYRIKSIKKYVDQMFSILPFEVDYYENKHKLPIHYVGNPTADEVRNFKSTYKETREEFYKKWKLDSSRPIIAILAGSRKQEIKDNLPAMIEAVSRFPGFQIALAGAPGIDKKYYLPYIENENVGFIDNQTYALLTHSQAALVTSGTATLETALLGVPQVVCYKTPIPHIIRLAFNYILKVKYISLVNLIADKEVVSELFADKFNVKNIVTKLQDMLICNENNDELLSDYQEVSNKLGDTITSDNAAKVMLDLLKQR